MTREPLRCTLLLLTLLPLVGCQALLPYQRTSVESEWQSFEEAKAAFEAIEAGTTTRSELSSLGFDPYTNDNVEILTFVDIFRWFWGVAPESLDPAVRGCLEARDRCTGLAVEPMREFDQEYGSFWLNLLEFRTRTEMTGWLFGSTLVMVDDVVVYKLWNGNPMVRKRKEVVRPLGPLQDVEVDFRLSFP